jgi:hypothetical protein
MLSENATLILSSSSTINPCVSNATKTQFTWSNINMRNIMGPMWEKYDMFCLKVVSFSTVGAVTFIGGSNTGVLQYNMGGLSWANLQYETVYMSQQWVPLGVLVMSGSANQWNITPTNTGQSYNFYKGTPTANLQIFLSNNDGIGLDAIGNPSGGNTFNEIIFHFTIEPLINQ